MFDAAHEPQWDYGDVGLPLPLGTVEEPSFESEGEGVGGSGREGGRGEDVSGRDMAFAKKWV